MVTVSPKAWNGGRSGKYLITGFQRAQAGGGRAMVCPSTDRRSNHGDRPRRPKGPRP